MVFSKQFGLLGLFSIALAVLGVGLVTIGAVLQAVYFDGEGFVEKNALSAPSILVAIGIIIFIIAFLGCWGSLNESYNFIMAFSVFMSLLLILEIAGGVTSYVKRNDLEQLAERALNDSLVRYPNNTEIQKSWNLMQHELHCCGINSTDDWMNVFHNDTLPSSCCLEIPLDKETNQFICHKKDAFQEGCLRLLVQSVEKTSVIIGSVAIGIAIFTLIVVCYSCATANAIRREYQWV